MAESETPSGTGEEVDVQPVQNKDPESLSTKEVLEECAICFQTWEYPTELPCGHIFCFLCLKGLANQSNKCALCRRDIPVDYFKNPKLVDKSVPVKVIDNSNDKFCWFYEGSNGWWMYDERTNMDLEEAYKLGEPSCELMICGALYVIDFRTYYQYRKNDPRRRRRIKRDLVNTSKKGIAGLQKRVLRKS